MVLVDSTVWIEALRRQGRLEVKLALEGLFQVDAAFWCPQVKLEVLAFVPPAHRATLERHFESVPLRACLEPDWANALRLGRKLFDSGQLFPARKIFLAALAMEERARLFTLDPHFQQLAAASARADRESLRLYKPGYGGVYRPARIA